MKTNSTDPRMLVSLDLETTGVNVATDRIVSLAMVHYKRFGDATPLKSVSKIYNPGIPIPDEAIAVHGISNTEANRAPLFCADATRIHSELSGCDLCGFNLLNFDVPLLWEEFYRCGIEWDLTGVRILDAGNIFKKKEERTLSAAVRFYLGENPDGAHTSSADALFAMRVLLAQLKMYPDLGQLDIDALAKASAFDDRVDLAGKIVLGKDGTPCYGFGKHKGTPVLETPSFANWMMDRDFPAQTKLVLRRILEGD